MKTKKLAILKNDPWLEPFSDAIIGRHNDAINKETEITSDCGSLVDFANAHQYFGLHKDKTGWVFREWAPNATAITLVGDFSEWREMARYSLKRLDGGVWKLKLPAEALHHGDFYKMLVKWDGGQGERIPAYATRVVQDENTHLFSAQVWNPEKKFRWKDKDFVPETKKIDKLLFIFQKCLTLPI